MSLRNSHAKPAGYEGSVDSFIAKVEATAMLIANLKTQSVDLAEYAVALGKLEASGFEIPDLKIFKMKEQIALIFKQKFFKMAQENPS